MVRATTIVEWPSEKNSPNSDRAAALLHELARHVVDRRDMVGVERVPEAETVGESRRAEKHRVAMEGSERPKPGRGVEDEQQDIDRHDLGADILLLVVEQIGDVHAHAPRLPAAGPAMSTEVWSPRKRRARADFRFGRR